MHEPMLCKIDRFLLLNILIGKGVAGSAKSIAEMLFRALQISGDSRKTMKQKSILWAIIAYNSTNITNMYITIWQKTIAVLSLWNVDNDDIFIVGLFAID